MHHQEIIIISDTGLSQPFELAWSHYMMHTYANFYEYNIKTEKTRDQENLSSANT